MATHDPDLEYGPTPEHSNHEYTDIEPSVAWKFAAWLAVGMLASAAIVYGTFWLFEGREGAADRAAQTFPLAAGQVREPPAPRLQTQPFRDISELRQREAEQLTTYGWVDKNTGVTRLPIDRAMQLMLERGVRVQSGSSADGVNQIVQDSSSGRTSASR